MYDVINNIIIIITLLHVLIRGICTLRKIISVEKEEINAIIKKCIFRTYKRYRCIFLKIQVPADKTHISVINHRIVKPSD